MKKRSIWVALCVITIIGVIVGWNWHSLQPRPQVVETSFQRSQFQTEIPRRQTGLPKAQPTPALNALAVNPDRLWADVNALAFKRYQEGDRSLARSYIMQALSDAGWSPQVQTFETGVNIVAERLGTDPASGKILVGAHYDTVEQSPGADDNATAVATVLEVARLLGSLSTPRTLQLALFDQEEVGLLGSFAYVDRIPETNHLQGAVILEMLGYACYEPGCQRYPIGLPIAPPTDIGNFLAVVGDRDHMPLIHSFEQASRSNLPPVVALPIPLVQFLPPDLLRSDHAPFWNKGIGAVIVTDTANFRSPHYHQPSDNTDAIDRAFFKGAAQLVVNAVTGLLSSQDSLATETSTPPAAPASVPATSL
jgi:hypothetical protein